MNITVHIERLILDGIAIPHRHRPQVQAALEEELARLLSADGLATELQASGARKQVTAGVLELKADDEPSVLGKKIAQAVYRGIGQ